MLSGKQREIKEREALFLEVARSVFLQEGLHGLTVGRIARETGFSKSTIYQRFSCKEELIVELAIQGYEQLMSALVEATQYPGRPRERIVALGEAVELYWEEFSDNARILAIIETEAVLERVPTEQKERLAQCDRRGLEIILGIVNEAIEVGDLVMPHNQPPESLCIGLWALADGWAATRRRTVLLGQFGIENALAEILRNAHRLMDGCGWRPLYGEWDYWAVSLKVREALKGKLPRAKVEEPGTEQRLQASGAKARANRADSTGGERRVITAK